MLSVLNRFNISSVSEVANQSQTSGCLVTSGRCWPSAADEEWYSPKGLPPVAIQHREESSVQRRVTFSFDDTQHSNYMELVLFAPLRPSWDQTAFHPTILAYVAFIHVFQLLAAERASQPIRSLRQWIKYNITLSVQPLRAPSKRGVPCTAGQCSIRPSAIFMRFRMTSLRVVSMNINATKKWRRLMIFTLWLPYLAIVEWARRRLYNGLKRTLFTLPHVRKCQ